MERTVDIGGKETRLLANGATPRKYRSLFPDKDIFRDMSGAVSPKGEILNSEVFENIAYCMAVQGGLEGVTIEEWLEDMNSPLAVLEASPTILELWNAETNTTSIGKKG